MLAKRLENIQRASRWLQALLVILAPLALINRINTLEQPFPPDTRTLAGVVFHGTALTRKIQILWVVTIWSSKSSGWIPCP
jgi:hypothetical protein